MCNAGIFREWVLVLTWPLRSWPLYCVFHNAVTTHTPWEGLVKIRYFYMLVRFLSNFRVQRNWRFFGVGHFSDFGPI